jgi:hypothetical protein
MKYKINILAVVSGLALAMTAAYASSEAPAARPAATSARTQRFVVPAALSPAVTLICQKIGGACLRESVCIAAGGTAGTAVGGCPSGTVCCFGVL